MPRIPMLVSILSPMTARRTGRIAAGRVLLTLAPTTGRAGSPSFPATPFELLRGGASLISTGEPSVSSPDRLAAKFCATSMARAAFMFLSTVPASSPMLLNVILQCFRRRLVSTPTDIATERMKHVHKIQK